MTESKAKNPIKNILLNLSVALVSILLTFVMLEVGLRLIGRKPFEPTPNDCCLIEPWGPVYTSDHLPGWVNSHNAFDIEHDIDKPEGVYRVGLLGDSFLGQPYVVYEDQVPVLLANDLNALNHSDYEVLNFSMTSAGTINEYLRYEQDASQYDLDLVILFFSMGSDIPNNSYVLHPMRELTPWPLPTYILQDDGSLEASTIPPAIGSYWYYDTPLKKWLVDHSIIYGKVSRLWQEAQGVPTPVPYAEQLQVTTAFLQSDSPYQPEIEDAWEVTRQVTLMLKQAAEEDGAAFAIVVIPSAWDIEPEWKAELYETLETELGTRPDLDFDRPYREFDRQFEGTGIPILRLREPLLELAAEEELPLYDETGHWSDMGHDHVSALITQFLQAEELIPSD